MIEQKKEIKINKSTLTRNMKTLLISIVIVFTIMLLLSFFGKIEERYGYDNFRFKYSGILTDYYSGAGNISLNEDGTYNISSRNIIVGNNSVSELSFIHKLFVFYLPLVLIEKLEILILFSIVLFIIFKLKSKFNKKYSIKFE